MKKLIASMLACAICLSLFSMTAFAEGTETTETGNVYTTVLASNGESETVYSVDFTWGGSESDSKLSFTYAFNQNKPVWDPDKAEYEIEPFMDDGVNIEGWHIGNLSAEDLSKDNLGAMQEILVSSKSNRAVEITAAIKEEKNLDENLANVTVDVYEKGHVKSKALTLADASKEEAAVSGSFVVKVSGTPEDNDLAATLHSKITLTVNGSDGPDYAAESIALFPDVKSMNPATDFEAVSDTSKQQYGAFTFNGLNYFENSLITKIGIPVAAVSALDDQEYLTVGIYNTAGDGLKETAVSTRKLYLPEEELGDNKDSINKWIYVDLSDDPIAVGEGQTIAFGAQGDTVYWRYIETGSKGDQYKFCKRVGFSDYGLNSNGNIFFDIYLYREEMNDLPVFPNLASMDLSQWGSVCDSAKDEYRQFTYQNLTLFEGKTITKIGVPVAKVAAIDGNQTITVSVYPNTVEGLKGTAIKTYTLKLPEDQLGTNKDSVQKWVYIDLSDDPIVLESGQTLAFSAVGDTVAFAFKDGGGEDRFKFYMFVGKSTVAANLGNIFFDVYYLNEE